MFRKYVTVYIALVHMVLAGNLCAQEIQIAMTPEIGAEIFIEPGQTKEEIDTWFRQLHENHMSVTRIRMFENYMRNQKGEWDFMLFDWAFEAGERYGIKIYGNLFPATSFSDIGGFKFPRDAKHLMEIAEYIKHLTLHFKKFSSLYGWVPINEPGTGGYVPTSELTQQKMAEWKAGQSAPSYDSMGFPHFDFENERFLLAYNTWFLKWLIDEIHRYDPGRPIHVNNHDIFRNAAEYDFPAWRQFLTSLGGSAHASWHFQYFNRKQYTLAVDANSEIIRSGAGSIPWFMTELQGGNNVYSGYEPICPTAEEITQWLWGIVGAEGKGGIFWCLNPRASGVEAGEWALLDFQNQPTERLQAAAKVAHTLAAYEPMFSDARVIESGINLLYIRETLWVEAKLAESNKNDKYEARKPGASMKSLLGYHAALATTGVQSNIKEIGEFDFSNEDYTGITIILAHQIAVPSRYWQLLETFVARGGTLLVDGLTAYYDEHAVCIMRTGFPFGKLFGGYVSEFKFRDSAFTISLTKGDAALPSLGWMGCLKMTTGESLATAEDGTTVGIRNRFGKGEVIWIPTLLGLANRNVDMPKSLVAFLHRELLIDQRIIRFAEDRPGMLMKTMESNGTVISILINKSGSAQSVDITGIPKGKIAHVIFSDKPQAVKNKQVTISNEGTVVIMWE